MARVILKVGDIFAVNIGENTVRFFQYISTDSSQLQSEVIRVFKRDYKSDENIDLNYIINDEVDWYAHCFLKMGFKLGYWNKVGRSTSSISDNPLFRDTYDYGRAAWQEPILTSINWVVWKVGQEFQQVGRLEGENRNADIGMIMSPDSILYRLINGVYDMPFYPSFE